MNNFPTGDQGEIFSDVDIFVYVLDINNQVTDEDLTLFQTFLKALSKTSPSAIVYCLIHQQGLPQENADDKVSTDKYLN